VRLRWTSVAPARLAFVRVAPVSVAPARLSLTSEQPWRFTQGVGATRQFTSASAGVVDAKVPRPLAAITKAKPKAVRTHRDVKERRVIGREPTEVARVEHPESRDESPKLSRVVFSELSPCAWRRRGSARESEVRLLPRGEGENALLGLRRGL